jgi:hypothetical protein
LKSESIGCIQLVVKKRTGVKQDGTFVSRIAPSDTSSVKVWEQDKKIAGKISLATRYASILSLPQSFGVAEQVKVVSRVTSKPHRDTSQNHTLTIKYKTKTFLQMIGRIPVVQELKRDRVESPDLVEHAHPKKIKVEMEGMGEAKLNIVDGVIVID